MGESSRGLAEKAKNNPAFVNGLTVTSKGRILPNPGAIPIVQNNEIIGSVGISGDKGENDEKIWRVERRVSNRTLCQKSCPRRLPQRRRCAPRTAKQ